MILFQKKLKKDFQNKTLAEWMQIYEKIVINKPITKKKTIDNRKNHHKKIVAALGDKEISCIRPHDISDLVNEIYKTNSHTAKRVLIEAKDLFQEAVEYGWIDRNPASSLKQLRVKVKRLRLGLKDFKSIYEYSKLKSPPWVSRMLLLAVVTGQRRSDLMKMKFSDIWQDKGEDYLHVIQYKTGSRIRIPLDLRLNELNISLREIIEDCKHYAKMTYDEDTCLIRKSTGNPLSGASMSWRFEDAREKSLGIFDKSDNNPPSLHECRSLSERLYRDQGINTMILLGHSSQTMTDLYNDDRGLDVIEGKWKVVNLN